MTHYWANPSHKCFIQIRRWDDLHLKSSPTPECQKHWSHSFWLANTKLWKPPFARWNPYACLESLLYFLKHRSMETEEIIRASSWIFDPLSDSRIELRVSSANEWIESRQERRSNLDSRFSSSNASSALRMTEVTKLWFDFGFIVEVLQLQCLPCWASGARGVIVSLR